MEMHISKTSQKIMRSVPTMDIHIQKNAHVTCAGVFVRGWEKRRHMRVFLEGEYSYVSCFFTIIGSGKETFPFDISVFHTASCSTSFIAIRSVLFGESKVDSHGLIRVQQSVKDAITSFSHHALLFSEKSSASILPTLEILSDSAQAHHAASVSQLDADTLWYLMSRGISKKEAEPLLIEGFFDQDIQKIKDHSLQKKMREKIRAAHTLYA